MTSPSYHPGDDNDDGDENGNGWWSREAPNAGIAIVMVSTLSRAKLPLNSSHDWVKIITRAGSMESVCVTKRANGTTSCVKWLASTSISCSRGGRWWKYQLSGFGIGC